MQLFMTLFDELQAHSVRTIVKVAFIGYRVGTLASFPAGFDAVVKIPKKNVANSRNGMHGGTKARLGTKKSPKRPVKVLKVHDT